MTPMATYLLFFLCAVYLVFLLSLFLMCAFFVCFLLCFCVLLSLRFQVPKQYSHIKTYAEGEDMQKSQSTNVSSQMKVTSDETSQSTLHTKPSSQAKTMGYNDYKRWEKSSFQQGLYAPPPDTAKPVNPDDVLKVGYRLDALFVHSQFCYISCILKHKTSRQTK